MYIKQIKKLPTVFCDVVIPIGKKCRAAYWLQKFGLRQVALPLDWIGHVDLNAVSAMLDNGVNDWFADYTEDITHTGKNRLLRSNKFGLTSKHAFPRNVSADEYMPTFLEIFNRRYNRLIKILGETENVCLLGYRQVSDEDLMQLGCKIVQRFKNIKHLTFINIHHSDTNKITASHYGRKIKIYQVYGSDVYVKNPLPDWTGNHILWSSVCRNICLGRSHPVKNFIKRIFSITGHNKYSYKVYLLGFKITLTNKRKRYFIKTIEHQEQILKVLRWHMADVKRQIAELKNMQQN